MPNVRVIYASTMSDEIGQNDIQDILAVARRNNQKMDLTGILCFGSRQFLQCLEGPREAVNRVYSSIIKDSRHTSVVLLHYEEIDSRDFSDWHMGYVPESSITRQLIESNMDNNQFAPLNLHSHSALTFLKEVKKCIPTI